MTLSDYLTKHHITTQRFSKRLGVAYSTVSKWRIKNRTPRSEMIKKINKVTKGRVGPSDWY